MLSTVPMKVLCIVDVIRSLNSGRSKSSRQNLARASFKKQFTSSEEYVVLQCESAILSSIIGVLLVLLQRICGDKPLYCRISSIPAEQNRSYSLISRSMWSDGESSVAGAASNSGCWLARFKFSNIVSSESAGMETVMRAASTSAARSAFANAFFTIFIDAP